MIHSGAPLVDIPDQDLVSFVLAGARRHGAKPALIDGVTGRTIGYAELERRVYAFAAGLAARGFRPGDTFAICMPNAIEYAIAFYGVLAAGGCCTTANPLYTARELRFQVLDSGARMLLTVPACLGVAREATRDTDCDLVVLGDTGEAASFASLLGDPEAAPCPAIDPATTIAAIPYSSGTTGLPKGVMLSHRNLVANAIQMDAAWHVAQDEVAIAVLPFFHIYGLSVIINLTLWSGGTLVTMPRFELGQYLALSERYRVTRAYVVPPIALALAHDPAVGAHDLSSLRTIISAAAPLGTELAQACAARIGCPVIQGYGMTELSPAALLAPIGAPGDPGSVGGVVPGTECRLRDPVSGADAPSGEPGEVLIRGPQVMLGYLHNPVATAAIIDRDGWLRTGDVAIEDGTGCFRIVDRVKELIKYKGFQVAPAELEAILVTHPGVADCAVIGVPDDEAGELPKAFIVPACADLDAQEVVRFVADQVAPHKQIRQIELLDEIPKSPSGKILRRVLRDRTVVAPDRPRSPTPAAPR